MLRTRITDQIEMTIRTIVAKTINSHLETGHRINPNVRKKIWFDLIHDEMLRDLFTRAFNQYQEPFNDFIFYRLFNVILQTRGQMLEFAVKWNDSDLLHQL